MAAPVTFALPNIKSPQTNSFFCSEGSVVVHFTMFFCGFIDPVTATTPLRQAIKSGKLGDITVEKDSFTIMSLPTVSSTSITSTSMTSTSMTSTSMTSTSTGRLWIACTWDIPTMVPIPNSHKSRNLGYSSLKFPMFFLSSNRPRKNLWTRHHFHGFGFRTFCAGRPSSFDHRSADCLYLVAAQKRSVMSISGPSTSMNSRKINTIVDAKWMQAFKHCTILEILASSTGNSMPSGRDWNRKKGGAEKARPHARGSISKQS